MDLGLYAGVLLTYCFGLGLAVGGGIGCYQAAVGATDRLSYGRLHVVAVVLGVEESDAALRVTWLIVGPVMVLLGGGFIIVLTLDLAGSL